MQFIAQFDTAITVTGCRTGYKHDAQHSERIHSNVPFATFDPFAAVVAAFFTTHMRGFATLAVDHRCAWFRSFPRVLPHRNPHERQNGVPRPITKPFAVVLIDVAIVREIAGHQFPLATCTLVHHRIYNPTTFDFSWTSWPCLWCKHGLYPRPLLVGQVCQITHCNFLFPAFHYPKYS